MTRITSTNLRALALTINRELGCPTEYRMPGQAAAAIGHFHIDSAYGGWKLVQTTNTSGGITDILGCGFVPARTLYDLMHAFRAGFKFNRLDRG